jgi:hypothetical protein
MIRRREKMKKENLTLTSEIFEKRYLSGDFEGRVIAEVNAQKPVRLALQPSQVQWSPRLYVYVGRQRSKLARLRVK